MSVKLAQLCFNGNVIVEAPWWWIFKKKILLEKCLKWSEMVRKVKTLTSEIFALYQVPLAKDLEKICKFFKNVFFALTRRHYFILQHIRGGDRHASAAATVVQSGYVMGSCHTYVQDN